jgi:hypothetical protein
MALHERSEAPTHAPCNVDFVAAAMPWFLAAMPPQNREHAKLAEGVGINQGELLPGHRPH